MKGIRVVLGVLILLTVGAGIGFAACPTGQVEAQPGVCIIDGAAVPKYLNPLIIPPVMPLAGIRWDPKARKFVTYYEIEVTQFQQQILPASVAGPTTVWSYSAVGQPQTKNYPAFTIEALKNVPTRVKWINNLKDPVTGKYLPHLLPVDQTLHWANPPQECRMGDTRTDCEGVSQAPYTGPVPLITHVHGAHVRPESDGYPEAWWLPAASDIPPGYATQGSNYSDYLGGSGKGKGFAVFQYPIDQPATTLWYHDHTLGMTRSNVYAGPAGFFLIRDLQEAKLNLPGPPPLPGSALFPFLNPNNPNISKFLAPHEIPIAIQDRSFTPEGQLFYPGNRDFFEGLAAGTLFGLGIRFAPQNDSDVAPIWNPEAFFNTMVVNGRTWPFLNVEPRKYRFRFLNGCNSRFLILQLRDVEPGTDPSDPDNWVPLPIPPTPLPAPFKQIGSDQGLLSGAPAVQNQLLMGLAERADVIVDFSGYAPGSKIVLTNVGPDEPFSGLPVDPAVVANPASTGQVMVFNVVPLRLRDVSASPATLPVLPATVAAPTRKVSVNEAESANQQICVDGDGNIILINGTANRPNACTAAGGSLVPFGPTMALLGTVNADGSGNPLRWADTITENPALGATETWEIYNYTVDAHPIHLHLVHFRVIDRQPFDPLTGELSGASRPPEAWETGGKDTVIAYPGEITRVQSTFDIPGIYVWHCHIVEHEDNEMMRPYCVGDLANCKI